MLRKIFILCLMGLVVAVGGMTFAQWVPLPSSGKVPKGWEDWKVPTAPPWIVNPGWANLPGSVKEASLKNFPYTYIPVRVTVTDNLMQKSPHFFFEFQGSAVAKGWLQINNDLTGFHLLAMAPKPRFHMSQSPTYTVKRLRPGGYLDPIPIGSSFKITKLNGWFKTPRSGYRNKRRIKFDRSKLNGSLVVDLNYPSPATTKTNLELRFPRPMMVSPPEGGGHPTPPLGPHGIRFGGAELRTRFMVTPAMMKKFVDQGYWSKTFSFEDPGYHENINIKIEFLKMGKPSVIATPTPVPKKEEEDEEEKWEVFLTGYEIDEMNKYWQTTTRLRGAVRFDWKLRGKFTIVNVKKKGVRIYKDGVITISDVGLSSLYEPISVWLTKRFRCRGCKDVKKLTGKFLRGTVAGNAVSFYWGSKRPSVNVKAKIVVPCKPMPDCARWKEYLYFSGEFLSRVNYVSIPLVDGATVPGKVVSPQGSRWINYNYLLRRLK